jgi:hypothetical protein
MATWTGSLTLGSVIEHPDNLLSTSLENDEAMTEMPLPASFVVTVSHARTAICQQHQTTTTF